MLDLVRDQYANLAPRLGTEDRQRLDQHRALIADLEAQTKGRAMIACTAPTKPTQGGKCSGGEPQPATVGAFLKLVTAAMACDLTRVAWSTPASSPTPTSTHLPATSIKTSRTGDSRHPAATQMGNYYRVHATQFGDLISQFSKRGHAR